MAENKTGDKIKKIKDSLTEVAQDLSQQAKPVLDDIKDATIPVIENARKNAEPYVENIKSKAQPFIDDTKKKTDIGKLAFLRSNGRNEYNRFIESLSGLTGYKEKKPPRRTALIVLSYQRSLSCALAEVLFLEALRAPLCFLLTISRTRATAPSSTATRTSHSQMLAVL